jgi:hypothetical protein
MPTTRSISGASSGDYDPSPGLEGIQATILAINSADDERNPPETGILDRELKHIKSARLYLIPASEDTRGHLTAALAKFWKQQLQDLLATTPKRGTYYEHPAKAGTTPPARYRAAARQSVVRLMSCQFR